MQMGGLCILGGQSAIRTSPRKNNGAHILRAKATYNSSGFGVGKLRMGICASLEPPPPTMLQSCRASYYFTLPLVIKGPIRHRRPRYRRPAANKHPTRLEKTTTPANRNTTPTARIAAPALTAFTRLDIVTFCVYLHLVRAPSFSHIASMRFRRLL